MKLIQMLKTIYVFKNEQTAILKEKSDKKLIVHSSSIDLDELKDFLSTNGYTVC